jgi:hypothetical protein
MQRTHTNLKKSFHTVLPPPEKSRQKRPPGIDSPQKFYKQKSGLGDMAVAGQFLDSLANPYQPTPIVAS